MPHLSPLVSFKMFLVIVFVSLLEFGDNPVRTGVSVKLSHCCWQIF